MALVSYHINEGPRPSVSMEVEPGHSVICGSGALLARHPNFTQQTKLHKYNNRLSFLPFLSGESLFINEFTNKGTIASGIDFSNNKVGCIIVISDELDQGILCARGAFMAANQPLEIGLRQARTFTQASLTSQSKFMQFCKAPSPQTGAVAFFMASSQPIEKKLHQDEIVVIDNTALFAMTPEVKFKLLEHTNLKARFGSGEGRFMTVIEGPGTVWLTPHSNNNNGSFLNAIKALVPG